MNASEYKWHDMECELSSPVKFPKSTKAKKNQSPLNIKPLSIKPLRSKNLVKKPNTTTIRKMITGF